MTIKLNEEPSESDQEEGIVFVDLLETMLETAKKTGLKNPFMSALIFTMTKEFVATNQSLENCLNIIENYYNKFEKEFKEIKTQKGKNNEY